MKRTYRNYPDGGLHDHKENEKKIILWSKTKKQGVVFNSKKFILRGKSSML